MIIGNGDIAQACKSFDREDRIYFASGVSNSRCTDEDLFDREKDYLPEDNIERFIYFSSLSIYYQDNPYTEHKRNMEIIIKDRYEDYCIIRLGNITWGDNPNTIINFLKNRIKNGEHYEVQDTFRYLCSRDEFNHWLGMIPDFNTEMNITGERVCIAEIVARIKAGLL